MTNLTLQELQALADFQCGGHRVLISAVELHDWHWTYQIDGGRFRELAPQGARSLTMAIKTANSRARLQIDQMTHDAASPGVPAT